MKEIPLLAADDIEVKVKKVTQKGAIALLYKTARTDMDMLDRIFGAENWQCRYEEIKGNLYCTILMKTESGEWVGKQDCGIESRSDGDGNEKKGEASDAFKRAGFRWGIGRELYTSPFVFLNVETVPDGSGYKLKNPFARFDVASIGYTDRRITSLTIKDDNGKVVFTTRAQAHNIADTPPPAPKAATQQPVTPKAMIEHFCEAQNITREQYDAIHARLVADKKLSGDRPTSLDAMQAVLDVVKADIKAKGYGAA